MVEVAGNLVPLEGGAEEGTLIKVVEEEAPTGEKQNQTSWGAKVQHQGIAVIFQLQHLEDAESPLE